MAISLAELTARVENHPRRGRMSYEKRWELCGSCTMNICDPKAVGCKTRAYEAQKTLARYWSDPEKIRARNSRYKRTHRQEHNERDRRYREACGEHHLIKRRDYYNRACDRINASTKRRRQVKRMDELIEDAPVAASECAPVRGFA